MTAGIRDNVLKTIFIIFILRGEFFQIFQLKSQFFLWELIVDTLYFTHIEHRSAAIDLYEFLVNLTDSKIDNERPSIISVAIAYMKKRKEVIQFRNISLKFLPSNLDGSFLEYILDILISWMKIIFPQNDQF